nr:hypothetical protein Iba_chr05aCG10340 [Ipomoea batatas]
MGVVVILVSLLKLKHWGESGIDTLLDYLVMHLTEILICCCMNTCLMGACRGYCMGRKGSICFGRCGFELRWKHQRGYVTCTMIAPFPSFIKMSRSNNILLTSDYIWLALSILDWSNPSITLEFLSTCPLVLEHLVTLHQNMQEL